MSTEFELVKNDESVFTHQGGTFRIRDLNNYARSFLTEYINFLNDYLEQDGKGRLNDDLLAESGSDTELLELGGKNWLKGKARLKVTIEFAPDGSDASTESTLDKIRQMKVNNNE